MSAAVSVEGEILSGSIPTAWRCTALRVSPARNGDPFDVIRKHDSRPCAEERTKQSWSSRHFQARAESVNSFASEANGLERLTGIGSCAGN